MKYYFQLTPKGYIYATYYASNEDEEKYYINRGFVEVTEDIYNLANPNYQYVDGNLIVPEEPEPYVPPEPVKKLDHELYFFQLNSESYITATYIAVTEPDLAYAKASSLVEVEHDVFVQASPTSRFIDGKIIPLEQVQPYPLRYFINIDKDRYIDGVYISFSLQDEGYYESKGYTELTKDQYESIGPDAQFIDGEVIKGPPKVVVLSPEANQAIKNARINYASQEISVLTDKTDPDLVDVVDPADVALLKKWKKYRLALTAVDVNNPEWPVMPE